MGKYRPLLYAEIQIHYVINQSQGRGSGTGNRAAYLKDIRIRSGSFQRSGFESLPFERSGSETCAETSIERSGSEAVVKWIRIHL